MVLDRARAAVQGDRQRDYGHPAVNHSCTASMFLAYLTRRYGNAHFDAVDVCAFNICQKLSRLANTPGHTDSLVDIAGYADNWDRVAHVVEAQAAATQSEYDDVAAG